MNVLLVVVSEPSRLTGAVARSDALRFTEAADATHRCLLPRHQVARHRPHRRPRTDRHQGRRGRQPAPAAAHLHQVRRRIVLARSLCLQTCEDRRLPARMIDYEVAWNEARRARQAARIALGALQPLWTLLPSGTCLASRSARTSRSTCPRRADWSSRSRWSCFTLLTLA